MLEALQLEYAFERSGQSLKLEFVIPHLYLRIRPVTSASRHAQLLDSVATTSLYRKLAVHKRGL